VITAAAVSTLLSHPIRKKLKKKATKREKALILIKYKVLKLVIADNIVTPFV
jgi:hypothetical protein